MCTTALVSTSNLPPCQLHQWQICIFCHQYRWCCWYQWQFETSAKDPVANLPPVSTAIWRQIMGTISDCWYLKVNLKEKIYLCVNLLPKGVQENFSDPKVFPFATGSGAPSLSCKYFHEFSKKLEKSWYMKKTWSRKSLGSVTFNHILINWKLHQLTLNTLAFGAKTQYGGIVICWNQTAIETNKKSKTVIKFWITCTQCILSLTS